jgi:enterochelin esterase family protein
MGGGQALNIAVEQLEDFAYVGVFSSGVFSLRRREQQAQPEGPSWEERNRAFLENSRLKEGLELFWFATGRDDFLIDVSRDTVALLKRHGFDVEFKETGGGHTWINWRNYLHEFVPRLFRD